MSSWLGLFLVVLLFNVAFCVKNESWGYITVRPDANMFYWLYDYEGKNPNPPLVLWLQGGPGGSGVGFGNFGEIGPLDVNQQPRKTTWLNKAGLLFVDNPVGTGYSYVTNSSAYATSVDQIAEDLITFFKELFKQKPQLQRMPFYIFSESYGGKMTAVFGVHLWKAIQKGEIVCKFRGIAMGDSWIHPEIIVQSWGTYLYATSFVDEEGQRIVDASAAAISDAIQAGKWQHASELWDASEETVAAVTGGVDWYNILSPIASHAQRLKTSGATVKHSRKIRKPRIRRLYQRHFVAHQNDALDDLMNGPIRKYLGVIPSNVTWGGQSADVFASQEIEFMKPVTDSVDYLLSKTTLKVVVYNGQLDLICDSIGVEGWVKTLAWKGLPYFSHNATREPLSLPDTGSVVGYVKNYKNFYFYWMLRGGHMLPADQGDAALLMLGDIIGS